MLRTYSKPGLQVVINKHYKEQINTSKCPSYGHGGIWPILTGKSFGIQVISISAGQDCQINVCTWIYTCTWHIAVTLRELSHDKTNVLFTLRDQSDHMFSIPWFNCHKSWCLSKWLLFLYFDKLQKLECTLFC